MALPTALLNRSATVLRSTGEVRVSGGWKEAPPTAIGSVNVRVVPAGMREAAIGGAQGAVVTHSIYASAASDIQRGDKLFIGGARYDVVAVTKPSVPDFYLKALAFEVQRSA